jgi:hypothetical protein
MARTLAQPATLTVTQARRRKADWHALTAHAILVAAVALLAFPLYYAFVISTQTLSQVTTMPPKPWPSTAMVANYAEAWQRAHMGRMLINSAIVALGVAIGKIAISLLSAFAIVYFDFRGKHVVFWMIFITLMLPVPVRIVSTYQVVSVLGWVNVLGSHRAAHGVRHGDVPVPAVLPHHPRLARRGGPAGRRGADALSVDHPASAVEGQHCGAVRDPVRLRMERLSVAADDHQHP